MKHILVIEDDPDIRELIKYNLTREGFRVSCAADGQEGYDKAIDLSVDLVILDLMLPKLSGIEVCKRLRDSQSCKSIPVIMLTAKSEETDIIFGLGIGADDYMTKPFSVKELIARVYTRLRSPANNINKDDVINFGNVRVDRAKFQVFIDDTQIIMTLAEFRLFNALICKPGIVLSRDRLLDAVTGGEGVLIDRNIDVHVRSIRKKLGDFRDLIQTVRGVGYKFKEV